MAGLLDNWDERSLRLSDDMDMLASGEINAAQMGLRTVGETMGGVGDAIAAPFDGMGAVVGKAIPETVKEGFADMMRGVMDTGPVKYAAKWLEEHPEQARDLSMAVNAAELLPWGRAAAGGVGNAMNAGIMETVTDMPGFYGGPAASVQAFSKAVADGVPEAVKTAVSPQRRAQRREVGTGQTRVDEVLNHDKAGTVRGSALASSMMGKQIDKRVEDKTIMDMLPSVRSEIGTVVDANDVEGAMKAFTAKAPDMPDHIAQKFLERNRKSLDGDGLLGAMASGSAMASAKAALPHFTNVGNSGKGKLNVIRDLDAPGSKLRPETAAAGGQTGGRAHQWLRNQKLMDRHEARLGRKMDDIESTEEFMSIASAFERGRYDKLKPYLSDANKSKGKAQLFDAYMDAKHSKPFDMLTDKQNAKRMELAGKVDGGTATPKQAAALKELTDKATDKWESKQGVVREVDEFLKKNKPNIAVDPDDPNILWYTTSYASTAQELGGVGQRMAIDTRNQKLYNSVMDGHDMFGMDPAGGVGLDTLVPPVQQGYGNAFVNLKTPDAAADQEWQYMLQLGERTGIMPEVGLHKRGPNKGKPDPKKREKASAYEKRVLREYKADTQLGDYVGAGANAASMGLLAMPNSGVEDEGRGY